MIKAGLMTLMLLSGVGAGIAQKERFSGRCRNLQGLIEGMNRLLREFQSGNHLTSRLLDKAAEHGSRLTITIFRSLSARLEADPGTAADHWPEEAERIGRDCFLSATDVSILVDWGCELGQTCREGQEQLIRSVISGLQSQMEEACRDRDTKGRMRQGLIFGLTAAAAILLL